MFGPPDLGQRQITEGAAGASRLPDDDLTRIPVWVAPDPAAAG
jgi:hypothetical protein